MTDLHNTVSEKYLYHWDKVESLARYANGELVVIATSIEDARKKAKDALIAKLKDRHDWLFSDDNTDDMWTEEKEKILKTAEEDIKKEPVIVESIAFLGSD